LELPTVIIGDSNDWRNRLTKGVFAENGFHQITAPASRFRSFPAYLAMGSLDKAFSSGEVFVRHARMVRSKAARIASDHLPLVVDLHLSKPPRV
jgi:endonuclease/exonuclease/phosphatase family metal-dependent hydrolase